MRVVIELLPQCQKIFNKKKAYVYINYVKPPNLLVNRLRT